MATITKRKSTARSRNEEAAEEVITASEVETTPLAWLTVETLLYGAIFGIGLALRIWRVGEYPFSDAEAQQGLAALQLYRGAQPEPGGSYSPLLATLNGLTFLIFHESNAAARLVPVLFGSLLILLPAALRRQLSPMCCLIAAALLAISPTAIFLSRTLNGEIATAAAALLILAGFFNWAENGRQQWLYVMAAGLAILLTAGPMGYSILIVFGLIILVKRSAFKELWNEGLTQSAQLELDQTGSQSQADQESEKEPDLAAKPALRRAAIFFAVALFLLATAATFNFGGFGVATTLVGDWISRFSFQPRTGAGFNAVFLLTIYEPLMVFAGLVGLAYALLSGNLLRIVIAGWFMGTLFLDLIMSGRPIGTVMLSLLPLSFLAAIALEQLWLGLRQWGSWGNEGIILASGLIIASFSYIGLTGWLARVCGVDDTFCQLAWLQPVAALALFALIVAFFWFISGPGPALRGLALTAATLALLAGVNIGWRLNFGPLMHLAFQPLAGIPASTELVVLDNTLASESSNRVGDATLLNIAAIGNLSPSLQWQLRAHQNFSEVSSVSEASASPAVITPKIDDDAFNFGEAYVGQDFAVDAIWSPVGLQPKALINWLLFRTADGRPQGNEVVLWLRLDGSR